MPSAISERIADLIRDVPPGKVTTYRDVAIAAGLPNGARQVARLLHSSSKTLGLPWQRVIKSDGSLALPEGRGRELQKALLLEEGVEFGLSGKVDLDRYSWDFR